MRSTAEAAALRVDLRRANLSHAHLSHAHLSGADLRWADVRRANLSGANLSGADLRRADLSYADISGAFLSDADLSRADVGWTKFGDNDLSAVKGLETVRHLGPSTVGIDTLYRSDGKIPEEFLRGAGVPEDFITFVPSLVGRAIEFYSCFISYSHQDEVFSQRHLAIEVREYYIPDFSNWKDHDGFEAEFAKLLRDLRATEGA